jgi:hypothetical protein
MSSLFNADSSEALSGSSTRVFSNSKESSGRPIIGLSSPKEKKTPKKEVFLKPLVILCDSANRCPVDETRGNFYEAL